MVKAQGLPLGITKGQLAFGDAGQYLCELGFQIGTHDHFTNIMEQARHECFFRAPEIRPLGQVLRGGGAGQRMPPEGAARQEVALHLTLQHILTTGGEG